MAQITDSSQCKEAQTVQDMDCLALFNLLQFPASVIVLDTRDDAEVRDLRARYTGYITDLAFGDQFQAFRLRQAIHQSSSSVHNQSLPVSSVVCLALVMRCWYMGTQVLNECMVLPGF